MYHLYCHVNQCPKCSSWLTGFYIAGDYLHPRVIKSMLKRGMYVMPLGKNSLSKDDYNCYCSDCNFNWRDDLLRFKLISSEQLEEEKELREIDFSIEDTNEFYEDYFDDLAYKKRHDERYMSKKALKKKKRKERWKKLLGIDKGDDK